MACLVNQLSDINLNAVGDVETLIKMQTKMMDDVIDNIGVGTVNDQEINELIDQ